MDQSEESLQALLITDLDRNFERLVLTYQDRLYAYVLSLARTSQAAEEIL
jgi:DNA-directed RNA polymerase specialized sigma24 family protein